MNSIYWHLERNLIYIRASCTNLGFTSNSWKLQDITFLGGGGGGSILFCIVFKTFQIIRHIHLTVMKLLKVKGTHKLTHIYLWDIWNKQENSDLTLSYLVTNAVAKIHIVLLVIQVRKSPAKTCTDCLLGQGVPNHTTVQVEMSPVAQFPHYIYTHPPVFMHHYPRDMKKPINNPLATADQIKTTPRLIIAICALRYASILHSGDSWVWKPIISCYFLPDLHGARINTYGSHALVDSHEFSHKINLIGLLAALDIYSSHYRAAVSDPLCMDEVCANLITSIANTSQTDLPTTEHFTTKYYLTGKGGHSHSVSRRYYFM